jgi:hypothetical protein
VKDGEVDLPMTPYRGVFMSMKRVYLFHVHVLVLGAINTPVTSQPFTLHTILHAKPAFCEACEACEGFRPVHPRRLLFHERIAGCM